jgi:hypothetical protein
MNITKVYPSPVTGNMWTQEKHADDPFLCSYCVYLMTKIEIDGKCRHDNSNHELKGNAVILIQIIKHVDSLFLRDIHNMNK